MGVLSSIFLTEIPDSKKKTKKSHQREYNENTQEPELDFKFIYSFKKNLLSWPRVNDGLFL